MEDLKYKVGDKVRIKSLDWYNENKDEFDQIKCGNQIFTYPMTKLCGKTVTITCVNTKDCYYVIYEDGCYNSWTDEMIECLVERNGKTYPYKIGDRVVLKGNNRCATITDLKYNSWGNLSYYINIDNDKDISIDYPTDLLLPYDNMVEGLVEEKSQPKFNIGDVVYSRTFQRNVVIMEILPGGFYAVGELYGTGSTGCVKTHEDNLCKDIVYIVNPTLLDNPTEEYTLPEGYIFKDGNGNVINTNKIVLEKKKREYPKTYEECINELGTHKVVVSFAWEKEMKALQTLLVCRDAYWKIAGREMGLEKPWEPTNETVYCISRSNNVIKSSYRGGKSNILEFPTIEMRDAFFNAFKDDIEKCKELL